jgi:hypothetical protein
MDKMLINAMLKTAGGMLIVLAIAVLTVLSLEIFPYATLAVVLATCFFYLTKLEYRLAQMRKEREEQNSQSN